jgi:uncharacterized protein (DUF1501 family)
MISRRMFMNIAAKSGLSAATAPLWFSEVSARAFALTPNTYKAIVVITMNGGNDGNNMVIPLGDAEHSQYSALRGAIAIPQSACLPLAANGSTRAFGLHPSLANIAALYNRGDALVVANIGPLAAPVTKAQLVQAPNLAPQALLSHPAGISQWESASTVASPTSGWGGRIADLITSQSGSLPPVLEGGLASIFSVGRSVQGIVLQNGSSSFTPLPAGIDKTIIAIAQNDSKSQNNLVSQAAQLRVQAMNQQALLSQAMDAGATLKTQFPQSGFGRGMQSIANAINGRSVIGASRQIFYLQQGQYDTHQNQLPMQSMFLSELDAGVGAFMMALEEIGLEKDVLVTTHSDFNRTYTSNVTVGSDHAWGSHQLILGGGIRGGRIIGAVPEPELNGSLDYNGYGTWIPDLSVTQMAASIGTWMGLSSSQIASVFPDLSNFAQGAITLT